jgi:hypothetical protein
MATTPALAPGGWVQLNPATESPRAAKPGAAEKTIGIIRQVFTSQGQQYYQVTWNPGDANPETSLYHPEELTALDQQTANQIRQKMAQGDYQANLSEQGSDYQQPTL